MDLKGTKTEQNLMTAFAGESQARNKYMHLKLKKMVMFKSVKFLKKQLTMKKNMQNYGLNICMVEKFHLLSKI